MLSTSAPTASCLACDPLMILSVSRQGKEMFYILRIQLNFIQWSSLAKERDISIFILQNQVTLHLPIYQFKSSCSTTQHLFTCIRQYQLSPANKITPTRLQLTTTQTALCFHFVFLTNFPLREVHAKKFFSQIPFDYVFPGFTYV